ncbi:8-oxoguanine deaminase [Baekduia alba]|uniref:amidohydrolase family protein n=1 Tax=Baekduia alba TaxID=2997333 RepID=UPI002341727E|nr:amidohydrolase family protein [Baekduia alba]WCB94908.1 8-oxoguanine deaminase [Baekduia alba]
MSAEDGPPPAREFILDADWVLSHDDDTPRLLRHGSVRVRDDRIVEVSDRRLVGNVPRVALKGQILLPGLMTAHVHTAAGTATRGTVETGRSAFAALDSIEQLEDEELEALTALNVAELVRSGCTTHVEMSLSLRQFEAHVRVARRYGVRSYAGAMIPGWPRLGPIWHRTDDRELLDSTAATVAEIEQYVAVASGLNGAEDGRIRPMMMPHAPDTHTPETLAATMDAARSLGNGIHIHVAQSESEVASVQRLWGMTPLRWLDSLGLFSERVLAAHLWYADVEADRDILLRDTFTYAHCPSSLGAGASNATQPLPEMLACGANVALGHDTHSNDLVENLKLAVLDGRARYYLLNERSSVPMRMPNPIDAMNAATINTANGLGRDDIGRIQVGAKADLCSVDVTGLLVGVGTTPREPLNHLLYANGLSVRHVITDGTFQVFHGRLLIDDEERVLERAGAVVERMWERLERQGWFDGEPSFPARWPHTWKV